MNRLLIFCFAFMAVTPFVWRFFHKPPVAEKTSMVKRITKEKNAVPVLPARLHSFGSRLKQFAGDNGYNTHFCFLVDMKIESVNNRFFVYDTQHDSVLYAGLVAHGYGNSNGENITFSNVPGSNSTSLGKYKIGNAYFENLGLLINCMGLKKQTATLLTVLLCFMLMSVCLMLRLEQVIYV